MSDPYGFDILAHDPHGEGGCAARTHSREMHVERGMILEDVMTGFVGAVIRCEKSGGIHLIELEDRHGRIQAFPLGGGFWFEGEPIIALPPVVLPSSTPALTTPMGRKVTNSGSVAMPETRAHVARASRIFVEGRHDAELVQRVWGDDLASVGVVVEMLEGVDNLADVMEKFGPTREVRAGVLVDHLVAGSKEQRIATKVKRRWMGNVEVLGHPFVDIWQAVKPERVGLQKWPNIPRNVDIKIGTLTVLGWPHASQADIARGWRKILSTVRNYRDLDSALLGPVEALIDFVTEKGTV